MVTICLYDSLIKQILYLSVKLTLINPRCKNLKYVIKHKIAKIFQYGQKIRKLEQFVVGKFFQQRSVAL